MYLNIHNIKLTIFTLFILLLLFAVPTVAGATVTFSEIMYDLEGTDSKREWIEVRRTEGENIADYGLYENNSRHKLTLVEGRTDDFSQEYVVIASDPAGFFVDHPTYIGALYDSVFSLNNTGEELSLLDDNDTEVDRVFFQKELGANGTGSSLQLIDGLFAPAAPTPGKVNATEVSDESSSEESGGSSTSTSSNSSTSGSANTSSHSSQNELSDEKYKPSISIGAGRERLVGINSPVEFDAVVKGESSGRIIYEWSYGDGTSGKGEHVTHIYRTEGDFNVVLNVESGDDKVTARTKVKVIKPILEVGVSTETDDFIISIKNTSKDEVNIGEYILQSGPQNLKLPKDTILSASSTTLFSGKSLDFFPIQSITLKYPNGRIMGQSVDNLFF